MAFESLGVACLAFVLLTVRLLGVARLDREYVDLDDHAVLAPGVTWHRSAFVDLPGGKNQTVNVISVELGSPDVEIKPIVQDKPGDCEPLSVLATEAGALAAVNGGFFHYKDGHPCTSMNLVKLEGEQLYDNWANRTALGIDHDGDFHIARVEPKKQWGEMYHALGGGPNLVTNGAVDIHPKPEDFGHVIAGWHPRTAVCLAKSDEALEEEDLLMLLTIDGRQVEGNGMTLQGVAESLIVLGCYNGFNLDGGGSSTIWTSEFGIMNNPSGGAERKIPTGLGIFVASELDSNL